MNSQNRNENQKYAGPERRVNSIQALEDRMLGRIEEVRTEILEHFDRGLSDLKEHVDSAYPENDPVEHKKYHEGLIRTSEKWEKIWTDIFTTIAKGGLWLLLAFIAAAVWQAFVGQITEFKK
jgi:hypothetical protein